MLRILIPAFFLVFVPQYAIAQNDWAREDILKKFQVSKSEISAAQARQKPKFLTVAYLKTIEDQLTNDDKLWSVADATVNSMINHANIIMRQTGNNELANEIMDEYQNVYMNWMACRKDDCKEIGDHPPLWLWLQTVHEKIESKIGPSWCKYTHLHDMYIFNFALPVVWEPQLYDLQDYLDHFAGHEISRLRWEHHGFAGITAYWTSYAACIAGTYGMGVLGFACTPISEVIEIATDKRIAPKVGKTIWLKAKES